MKGKRGEVFFLHAKKRDSVVRLSFVVVIAALRKKDGVVAIVIGEH
jgi:hypothetical protein